MTRLSELRERLTGLRESPRGRGVAWMSYAYAGGLLLQAAYFLILARGLGASGLGLFAGALALVSIAAPFAGWGSGNLLVQDTSRSAQAFRHRLGTALVTIGATGGSLILVYTLLGLTVFGGDFGTTMIPLACAELIFARVVDLCAQSHQAHDRLRSSANVIVLASFLRLVAITAVAILATASDVGPEVWAIGYASASVVAAAISITTVIRHFGAPHLHGAGLTQWREGFFFSLGSASKTVYSDIDKAMLARIASEATAGIYTAAYRVVMFAYAPIQALVYASNTSMFREGAKGANAVWSVARRLAPPLWMYSVLAGACLWLAAPLVPVALGESFSESVNALRWLAVMPIISGTHYLFGDALMGLGRQATRSYLQLSAAALNVGLNVWLIPLHGFHGAIAATIACEGALAVAMVMVLHRLRTADVAAQRSAGEDGPPGSTAKPGLSEAS